MVEFWQKTSKRIKSRVWDRTVRTPRCALTATRSHQNSFVSLSEKFKPRFTLNTVKIQKYNAANFLVIAFYEQFKFFFSLYFLLVITMQFVPALKIGLWSCPYFSSCDLSTTTITGFIATYITPLTFVLSVTMGEETYDDYKRHLRDEEANSAKYLILGPSGS